MNRFSIALSLQPLQAQSLRSHAFSLFIKRLHVLVASFGFGFLLIVATELFQRLFNGKSGCFGHGNPRIQTTSVQRSRQSKSGPSTGLAAESPGRSETVPARSMLRPQHKHSLIWINTSSRKNSDRRFIRYSP
jgi:hypothetical protein